MPGPTREVTSIAFAPDGRTLASRGADAVRLWDLDRKQEIRSFPSDGADFGTVVWRPDGRTLATEEMGQGVITFDPSGASDPARYPFPTPSTIPRPSPQATRGWGLSFSPDGKTLAAGGSLGGDDGFLALWKTSDPFGRRLPPVPRPITNVAFSPDGRTIAAGSMDGRIILWDAATHQERAPIKAGRSYLAPLAFSPDSRFVASSNEARWVLFWDPSTGKEVATFKGHIKAVLSMSFHPDGRTLATGDSGGTIFLWDIPSRKVLTRLEPKDHGKVWGLAFRPDGKVLASSGEDRKIHVWDISADR